ncbi:transposase [Rhodobacter sp. CZR27]|uniref:transposase n=1 Tax=Rhodobacter sp. CZR27 TaxID=2033869 RepID=UPI000BBEA412|nr:transposase [Rhodobacter sp. CZR27]
MGLRPDHSTEGSTRSPRPIPTGEGVRGGTCLGAGSGLSLPPDPGLGVEGLSGKGIGDEQTPRRHFTAEFKEQVVARLVQRGATRAGVARDLGVTSFQLKAWRLELEAAGSAESIRGPQAEAAGLTELRRGNRRLKEEVEVVRSFGCFRSVGGATMKE